MVRIAYSEAYATELMRCILMKLSFGNVLSKALIDYRMETTEYASIMAFIRRIVSKRISEMFEASF